MPRLAAVCSIWTTRVAKQEQAIECRDRRVGDRRTGASWCVDAIGQPLDPRVHERRRKAVVRVHRRGGESDELEEDSENRVGRFRGEDGPGTAKELIGCQALITERFAEKTLEAHAEFDHRPRNEIRLGWEVVHDRAVGDVESSSETTERERRESVFEYRFYCCGKHVDLVVLVSHLAANCTFACRRSECQLQSE
jgi:hypothetical protein